MRALTAEADGATKESARQALVGDLEIAHGEVNVKAGQVAELSAQLDALRRREADMRTSINDRAIRSARRARRIILAIAVVVTAVGAASLIPEVAAGMSGPILFLARCAAVLAFVATVFGTVTDGSKRFEDRFAELDEARRLRSVGLR